MTRGLRPTRAIFDFALPAEEEFRELAADLEQERGVLLEHGTEAPFCGVYVDEKREGVFTCRLCGLPLFTGSTKSDSATGCPSFTSPFAEGHLGYVSDTGYGMIQTEIVCARCGGRQGQVFPDGPSSTAQRYLHQLDLTGVHAERRAASRQARPRRAGRAAMDGMKIYPADEAGSLCPPG